MSHSIVTGDTVDITPIPRPGKRSVTYTREVLDDNERGLRTDMGWLYRRGEYWQDTNCQMSSVNLRKRSERVLTLGGGKK